MKTVVALYDEIEDARHAIEELVDSGIARDDISLIARDVDNQYSRSIDGDETADNMGEAAIVGATSGAVVGGLSGVLVGLGALAIPGIGPVVAAGPVIAGLTGAGIGAVAGGILGALVGWGIPEEEAEYYAEGIRRGGTLVAVRVSDDRADDVIDVLEDYDPIDVERRAEYWRSEQGWTGYDAGAEPYDADQLATYRQQRTTWESEFGMDDDLDYDDNYDDDDEYYGTGVDDDNLTTRTTRGAGTGAVRMHASAYGASDVTSSGTTRMGNDYSAYDDEFRRHFDMRYATAGYDYNRYQPAYRYGYTLGNDSRYYDNDWTSFESTARRGWETENDGAWEEFKDAVRHGWERAKDAVS